LPRAAVPLAAIRVVGVGRVCVVDSGMTGTALDTLWDVSHVRQLVPLFASVEEARRYSSRTVES